ncbi:Endoribonuclease L-PSP/chorismate mutase-like protein [Echria macrotheca]|uniref:Endoribonuclease L-PSP/chorismate mutase-like protein n=1 Tax=Echria macrotheca TaxID=438768 RepID=A0AAJ0B9A4_9PEZI|nr:Endoribonuclease L-PSP/chorismate mutase-like protein [Echria macrotheca]
MAPSTVQFFAYSKQGEVLRDLFWYTQSARVGDRIEISGQGGWDPETGIMKTDPIEEIDQAFANVELALKHAGGAGWSQVYKMRLYVIESHWTDEAFFGRIIENMKKWMPDHQPLLTGVCVSKLGAGPSAGMRVEIEAVAHVDERK